MPGPLIVGAEGVILLPDMSAYASSRPLNDGLELILQLEKFPTTLTTVLCHTQNQTDAEYFCKMQGLPHAKVMLTNPEDVDEPVPVAQWNLIQRIRAQGPVNLVVTSYKDVYTRCVQSYQAALLYGRKGALSTMEEAPSWQDLHDRVRATKQARLEDVPEGPGNRSEGF
jgi:hypothetical protein